MGDIPAPFEGRDRPDLAPYYDINGVSRFLNGTLVDAHGFRTIPKLVLGSADDIALGKEYDACDYRRTPKSRREHDRRIGLANFVRIEKNGIPIYVVDDHNWLLYAAREAENMGILRPGPRLLHIDMHDDYCLSGSDYPSPNNRKDLRAFARYVNRETDEGDFIETALKNRLFSEASWIDPEGESDWPSAFPGHPLEWDGIGRFFNRKNKGRRVLGVDVDYFVPHLEGEEVWYTNRIRKGRPLQFQADFDRIKSFIPMADLVVLVIPTLKATLHPAKGIEIGKKLLV